jgi:DNA polymerase-3 subunit alpha
LDSSLRPHELVAAAKADNQPAVALTDHGVMFGAIEFYKLCKKEGIKPIIGIEAYMSTTDRFSKAEKVDGKAGKNYYHIILLAKDVIGYKNLCKLSSIGFSEGFYRKPRIDKEVLEIYKEGLICTTACMGGIVNSDIISRDLEKAKKEAQYYKKLFGDDFYMEIQRHKYDTDEQLIHDAAKIARELDIKLICTNDTHYLKKEHSDAHNILLNIGNSQKNTDLNVLRYGTREFYFKSTAEMKELFADYPQAIANTLEIADKCNLEIDLKTIFMPVFPIPSTSQAKTLSEYLEELTYERLAKKFPNNIIPEDYLARTKFELKVIIDMGFPGYFLIVQDLIHSAKERGVPVGPGRGSAAGSLVAFALGITNIDPLKYDLLFERFLNPDRVSMPDIDIDFCDENRPKVLQYITEKYGKQSVAQIVTFSSLTSKAVIADVGRVMDIPLDQVRSITSAIPSFQGKVMKLAEAIDLPELEWVKSSKDEHIRKFWANCVVLEGNLRGRGTHAAGVIIAPSDVVNYIPTCTPLKDKQGDEGGVDLVTQYPNSGGEIEQCGLLKMDILGLQTLSIIDKTLRMIEFNHKIKIDLDNIPLDDQKTYDMIGRGETNAIFQFESPGMQEYLKQLKPQSIEDLTAMNALYRPGPISNIPDFIDRQTGKKDVEYLHPLMETVLKKTNGIIVYQEQVMQLVQIIGNFTLGEADILRRHMSKKKRSEMDKMKPQFISGAQEKGISNEVAEQIFELIFKFADYGFNKSHSVAYSFVAYQTAWLKAHYTAEFMAANMTAEMMKPDKLTLLLEEAKRMGIKILPPDINRSFAHFHAVDAKSIYYGLAGIRNVGVNVVESILEARSEGKFKNFFDFYTRVDKKAINKRALEGLIYAGAFDDLTGGKRASLFASMDLANDYMKAVEYHLANNTINLFGDIDNTTTVKEPELIEVPEWTQLEKLLREKEYLNLYISGHPYEIFESKIKMLSNLMIRDVEQMVHQSKVKIGSFLSDVTLKRNKDGNLFAVLRLEDTHGSIEALIVQKKLNINNNQAKLIPNTPVFIIGTIAHRNDSSTIMVDELYSLDEAIDKYSIGFKIFINTDNTPCEKIELVKNLQANNPKSENNGLVFSLYSLNSDFRREYKANFQIEANKDNFVKLQTIFSPENVKFIFKT